jgi:caffeoyl-CoA O-methyltransferase
MRCVLSVSLSLVITLITNFSPAFSDAGSAVFRIPRVEGIVVDGSDGDWGKQGFRVEILTTPDSQTLPIDDFDVKFRLGWNLQGLYVLVTVLDDIAVEHQNLSRLWRRDCVEISMAEDVGHSNRYMLAIASGADPKYGKLRKKIYDWRPEDERPSTPSFESASRMIKGGHIVEVMLPWENLSVEPKIGMRFALQLVANDDDGHGATFRVAWYPGIGPADPTKMHRLSLAEKPSEPVFFRIDRKIEISQYAITVQGAKELIGEEVIVRSADKIVARKQLSETNGRARAVFTWNVPEGANTWPRLSAEVSGKRIITFEELPTLEWILARYTQSIGGHEAFEKLTTRSCKGHYLSGVKNAGSARSTLNLEAHGKIPNKWTMSIHNSEFIEKNGFDGNIGWKQDADRVERADRLDQSILGWWLNPQGPIQLHKYFPSFVLKEKKMGEGPVVHVVESTAADGTKHILDFDAKTGLLSRIDNRWILKDYRSIDGIQYPFRLILSRGEELNIFELDEVKHNVPLNDSRFAKPDPVDVFADAFQGIEDAKVLPMLRLEEVTYEHGEMNIPIRDGRFLYDLILKQRYKRGLEIGTYNGYSTLWFALAFQKTGGKVITIEIEQAPAREAQHNFIKAGLNGVIDSRINDAFDEIRKIRGEFDFIFIDANKEDYLRFWKLLKDRVTPGGAVVAHNAINYARDMRDFLESIKNDPEFETTIHRTSGEGISVSIKHRLK